MADPVREARDQLRGLICAGAEPAGAVRLDLDGPVAHLRIDHPRARGAMTLSMMVDLADAVLALGAWDGALVLLSSTDPRAFCAGGHLGQLLAAIDAPEKAHTMCVAMGVVTDALAALPAVSVSAIDGLAVGGGAELVTATDFRVASPEARIHFVQARLGIAPGWGGTRRLARIVGRQAALRVLTTARPLFPGEAVELGLVDHRCEGRAVDGALEWLADLRSRPPEAIRAVKQQILATSRDEEASAFASVWGGPAHVRALRAERPSALPQGDP